MKPVFKFNAIVLGITTVIMFTIVAILSKQIFTNTASTIISGGISFLTSYGCYKMIFKIFKYLLGKFNFIKKIVFGDYYFEGTWVGFFIGHDENVRFFYEIFRQDLDCFLIAGKAFTEDGKIHVTWKAKDPVIDDKLKKITYYYEANGFSNSFINLGFASFDYERLIKNSVPSKLTGFSSDLFSPNKLIAYESKMSDKIISDHGKLFEEAKKLYIDEKTYFTNK